MTIPFNITAPQRMPPDFQSAAVPAALLDELAALIERRALMQFGADRRSHFVNTVTARARALGERDTASYIRRVTSVGGESELNTLIDHLTINETTFFRNVPQLNLFARVALPEVMERKRITGRPKRLEIWSAACSTGQEVYTLAILANEAVRLLPQWEVRVFGTDISPTVLETARRGVYPKARLDTTPPEYLKRYFEDQGDQIRVTSALRKLTAFQLHNLRDAPPAGAFDVIFCRNVMIYFSRDEQARLAQKFYERLAPEGFLFIGHSESLQGMGVNFQLRVQDGGVAYQKKG
jgi:chemotaxis protein methyltransferase CheR